MSMTTNPPAVVDEEAFTVRRTITISAPIDKVWATITQPELIIGWLGTSVELEPVAVGARGVFTFEGYGAVPVRVEELDPPRMIAFRWTSDPSADARAAGFDINHSTVFTYTLVPVDGGTQLTVVESGFENLSDPAIGLENNRRGWDGGFDQLATLLEGGA